MFKKQLIITSMILALAGSSYAAITAEEAKKLGTTLTEVGAEKAGNADGSIPAYSGGLTTPPSNFKKGGSVRPNPFAAEKPLYSINASNAAKYSDKLTEGTKALLKKYPSYRVDVFKTHRSVAFPHSVLENTKKAALTAKTTNNGMSLEGVREAYPFPIPKNGNEAMWNHLVSYNGKSIYMTKEAYYTNSAGKSTMVNDSWDNNEWPYWIKGDNTGVYWWIKTVMTGPPRRAGEAILVVDPINIYEKGRSAWQYLPGQRRVKLAPEIAHDTPDFNISGVTTFDDVFVFNGSMDRYNFKLLGKKEMLVPYNCYKFVYESKADKILGPNFLSPDYVRWELHRVWVVEATLKPGKRHVYSKRLFYLDEDSWHALASDEYDGHNQLYRSNFAYMAPSYDELAPFCLTHGIYDFIAKSYSLNFYLNGGGVKYVKQYPRKERTPDSLAGTGIR